MEKIGSGYQFNVYRSDNGKVVKKPKNRLQVLFSVLRDSPTYLLNPTSLTQKVNGTIERRQESLEKISKLNIDNDLIAGTEINNGDIIQNEVKVVQTLLKEEVLDHESVIQDYVELLIGCWRYGFSDRVYNFTINNGYRRGKMMLIDIGELHFSKEKVEEDIRQEKWLQQWSYTTDLPPEEKDYYRKYMREKLTVEKLNDVWAKKQH